MPSKTEKARAWAKSNFDTLQHTATPYTALDLTKALFEHVVTYTGGDSRLFLYSQANDIFFFNVNSSRNDVKELVNKVTEIGGLVFGSNFTDSGVKFIPIMGIKATSKV